MTTEFLRGFEHYIKNSFSATGALSFTASREPSHLLKLAENGDGQKLRERLRSDFTEVCNKATAKNDIASWQSIKDFLQFIANQDNEFNTQFQNEIRGKNGAALNQALQTFLLQHDVIDFCADLFERNVQNSKEQEKKQAEENRRRHSNRKLTREEQLKKGAENSFKKFLERGARDAENSVRLEERVWMEFYDLLFQIFQQCAIMAGFDIEQQDTPKTSAEDAGVEERLVRNPVTKNLDRFKVRHSS